ncbi:Uncharacterised protein [uncultured Clostridium sp.]|uniref:hypothetical protein n=1 Tax=uncultured Clostridium sp. TaxID=59620 RepID=UPI00082144C5|nr:hypothetical protein [uncultured Clostridium sp.]SCI99473.1 Uncharacterised protein [uncultured Clostridium sp.]
MKDYKYYIVKNRDLAICLKMLTQQEPYIYPNKFIEGEHVWSFRNDESFKEAKALAYELIEKNSK